MALIPVMSKRDFIERHLSLRPRPVKTPAQLLSEAMTACREAHKAFDVYPEDLEAVATVFKCLEAIAARGSLGAREAIEAHIETLKAHRVYLYDEVPFAGDARASINEAYADHVDGQLMKAREVRQAMTWAQQSAQQQPAARLGSYCTRPAQS